MTASSGSAKPTWKQLLEKDEPLVLPGAHDALSAKLIEQAGFSAFCVGGFPLVGSRYGLPDIGLVGLGEMAAGMRDILQATSLPALVDADHGYGDVKNVAFTIQTYVKMGAGAVFIEDQVAPKRCGHMAGKQVIGADEMVGKIKAALDARQDADTVLIARTDALAVNGFEDALERAERYLEAGADALFIEAPKTVEQMQTIATRFAARVPLVHNLVEGGGSPITDAAGLEPLGYRVALFPAALLHAFVPQAQTVLEHIRQHGSTRGLSGLIDLSGINAVLGAEELLDQAARYGS